MRRSGWLRPDNVGSIRAFLAFLPDVRGLDELDSRDQALILRETFRDAGWVTDRVLAGLDEPFYFESVGRVRLPRWSSGRVVLLGDAAWCASPLSGMGTSLALLGAYVLADALTTHDDHREAFARVRGGDAAVRQARAEATPGDAAPRVPADPRRGHRAAHHAAAGGEPGRAAGRRTVRPVLAAGR